MRQKVPVLTADYRGQILQTIKGAEAVSLPAPRAYYPLNGDLTDASGNGFDLPPFSTVFTAARNGQGLSSGSGVLDNQQILALNPGTGDWSIALWANARNTSGSTFARFVNASNQLLMGLFPTGGQNSPTLQFYNPAGSLVFILHAPNMHPDEWYHLGARGHSGVITLFFNGIPTPTYDVLPAFLGFDGTSGFDISTGATGPLFDELAVWNVALTDGQFAAIANHAGPLSDLLP